MSLTGAQARRGASSGYARDGSICSARWLGLIDYQSAYDLQRRIWAEKLDGRPGNTLLLLEHPPTLTIGKSGKLENLLVPQDNLAARGIALFFTDRGGDITYHGPGQLVAYPIIDLRKRAKDVHRYVSDLQEVMIRTLADYSIAARRDEKYVGVWAGDAKIGAIGVAIRRWVTMHGLALNVNPDMAHFSLINPCGIRDRTVTSITKLLNRAVPMSAVVESLVSHFAEVFSVRIIWQAAESGE